MVKLFLEDEVWQGWSNVEIANRCGVSEITVRRYRETIFDNVEDKKPATRKATRNGKTYTIDTGNIGKKEEPPE